jgi:hypothetical protein
MYFAPEFCQKILAALILLYFASVKALDVDVANFTAFNNAVKNSSTGTIFLIEDTTATVNINSQGPTTLTIAAKPDGVKRTIFGNKKTGFTVAKNQKLNIDDGVFFSTFAEDPEGVRLIQRQAVRPLQLAIM